MKRSALALTLGIVLALTGAPNHSARANERFVLPNGIHLLLYPVHGADRVVVASSFHVGLMNEPRGMAQAAHLIEHLVCRCATNSYGPEESFNLLMKAGDANAETLPDFTYFYSLVRPAELDRALQIEAERLTSLRITPESVRIEAPKCYEEAAFVERQPRKMAGKFGLAALHQAWQFGAASAPVRAGLEQVPIPAFKRLHDAYYRPQNMVLVLMGAFRRDDAIRLVTQRLGGIHVSAAAPPPSRSWSTAAKSGHVGWDCNVRAVTLAFPPPADRTERLALSFWGAILMHRLNSDTALTSIADVVECSNPLWSVGVTPFFVSATAKPGVDPARVRSALTNSLRAVIRKLTEGDVAALRFIAAQVASTPETNWTRLQEQGRLAVAQTGRSDDLAGGLALVQQAIYACEREWLLGPDPGRQIRAVLALSTARLQGILRRNLHPSRQLVTFLVPTARARR